MDDLISRKALWDALKFREGVYGTHSYDGFHYGVTAEVVANAPSVPAVPLDKLCEWLAEHYGSPCQLAEIDCYPQCEPDENGECYGMRTDAKRCWHDYLTKWMEGLDAAD